MKIILTNKQEITSKKGEQFVIFRGIDATGSTVEAFLPKAKADEFNIADGNIASKKQIADLFETLPVCEIEFNQRGQVQDLRE